MKDQLFVELARARAELQSAKDAQKKLLDDLQSSPEWVKVSAARAFANDRVETLEADIKDVAVATGKKHPHPAVTVKSFTVYKYDEVEAVQYCKKEAPIALDIKLNKSIFKSILEKTSLPFVIEEIELRAQISTDLSKYLEGQS